MTDPLEIPRAPLDAVGLNLVAVFPLDVLPARAQDRLAAAGYRLEKYRQLILIGHAGKAFWQALQQSAPHADHPVDTFSRQTVDRVLGEALQEGRYDILYPGPLPLDLQALGAQAGWHHASPFWVGVNARYGSWFAYRALILADSDFAVTIPWAEPSPCDSCAGRPCVGACPANAMAGGQFEVERCMAYRRQPDSLCRYQCLARNACPVGPQYRYDDSQMKHHYAASLRFIEAMS